MHRPTKAEKIAQAEELKRNAAKLLEEAYAVLCEAQNQITNVEGKGSCDIYEGLADAYQTVAELAEKTRRMKATGLFC